MVNQIPVLADIYIEMAPENEGTQQLAYTLGSQAPTLQLHCYELGQIYSSERRWAVTPSHHGLYLSSV